MASHSLIPSCFKGNTGWRPRLRLQAPGQVQRVHGMAAPAEAQAMQAWKQLLKGRSANRDVQLDCAASFL